jgi:hypothetical protein
VTVGLRRLRGAEAALNDTPRSFVTGGPPPRRLLRGTEQLQHLVGSHLLVGVTVRDEEGAIVSRQQFHGNVTEVADGVVVLRHADGELLLPAAPEAYEPARPGRYHLGSSEVVVDPDYLSTWSVASGRGPESDHS